MQDERRDIICDITKDLGEALENFGKDSFTGAFKIEFNFHKGDISKKVKCGIIETLTYPNK